MPKLSLSNLKFIQTCAQQKQLSPGHMQAAWNGLRQPQFTYIRVAYNAKPPTNNLKLEKAPSIEIKESADPFVLSIRIKSPRWQGGKFLITSASQAYKQALLVFSLGLTNNVTFRWRQVIRVARHIYSVHIVFICKFGLLSVYCFVRTLQLSASA